MLKRVVMGVATAALFSLGTGVALANAGVDSTARPAPARYSTPVSTPTPVAESAPAGESGTDSTQAWWNHSTHY